MTFTMWRLEWNHCGRRMRGRAGGSWPSGKVRGQASPAPRPPLTQRTSQRIDAEAIPGGSRAVSHRHASGHASHGGEKDREGEGNPVRGLNPEAALACAPQLERVQLHERVLPVKTKEERNNHG